MEIDHDPIPADSAARHHRAVRAVIHADGRLLMMHSQVSGDCRLPGGGVPAWVGFGEALATNRDVLASNSAQTWVARETRVLAELVRLL